MKLTKKKALEIAIELWGWIVDNPGKFKNAWPGWEKHGEMRCDCPLCEYADLAHSGCKRCPLKWGEYGCEENPISQYMKWHDAMYEDEGTDEAHKAAVKFLAQLKEL